MAAECAEIVTIGSARIQAFAWTAQSMRVHLFERAKLTSTPLALAISLCLCSVVARGGAVLLCLGLAPRRMCYVLRILSLSCVTFSKLTCYAYLLLVRKRKRERKCNYIPFFFLHDSAPRSRASVSFTIYAYA